MAKTKFLDYNGLSKLVEKIKNTYVNKDEQYEANLKWGGRNFAGSFGPIDAAMVPELGANRFAFGNPRGITVEYSNDGGNTWEDYEARDEEKLKLTSIGTSFYLGKHAVAPPSISNMLRITFDVTVDKGIKCYTNINKFLINVSTAGMSNCYCTVQAAKNTKNITYDDIATKVPIKGSSGYNVINVPYINTCELSTKENYYNYRYIRFIFGADSIYNTQYYDMYIIKIYAYGGMGWSAPSNLAARGNLYSYDESQNATFPANITATKFIGTLQGNASSASKLGTSTIGNATTPIYLNNGTPNTCSHSINADVPADAKFTDTTYNIYQNPRINNSFWITENDNSDTAQEIVINDVEHASKADSINVNDTPIGDATTPIYINSSGKPTAISYSINANVPSGAKFTDTTYTDLKGATASTNGTHGLVPAPARADITKFLKGDGTWSTPIAPTLSQEDVENILSGSTYSYSNSLNGDGLKIVMDYIRTLLGFIEIPYESYEIMNFSGGGERVAIKISEENWQYNFIDNYNNKFIKFNDNCIFTCIGKTLINEFPVFKGAVVDRMQGIDDVIAWGSSDGADYYLIFNDVLNITSDSEYLNDSYRPPISEIKFTW